MLSVCVSPLATVGAGLALGAALVLAPLPAAAAEESFGPRVVVAAPGCAGTGSSSASDAAYGGGRLRAFSGFYNGACGGRITFSSGGSQGFAQTATPYRGVVQAVAADDVATYLLYVVWDARGVPTGLGVTQRTHAGRFFPTTVLSTVAGTGAVPTTGDLAARDGRWWAVWSEQVGPGGELAHQQLFQAGTHPGTTRAKQRMTSTPADVDDSVPALALDDRGAVFTWSRRSQPARPGPADVWVAVSAGSTWERARAFSDAGGEDVDPDVARVGAVTLLAWARDGRVVEADNSSGSFREHVFQVPGQEPTVALAGGGLLVSWLTGAAETDQSYRVLTARGLKGGRAWDSAYVSDPGETLAATVGVNGRATVVMGSRSAVFSRTRR
ncbi:MAG: hypothetical protein JWM64_1308 [Frankiales bacterium]|nr:hypothetical protein [Frankiales bacterium]